MTYYQNMVFEPIEVITHHTPDEMHILKFRWKNKLYKVDALNNKWVIPNSEMFDTHFSVVCFEPMIIAELRLSHKDLKWELIQWDKLPKGFGPKDVRQAIDYRYIK